MQLFATPKRSTPLEIPAGASVSIVRTGRTDGYDGHSLRAYAYFGDQMNGVKQKMERINKPGKFYKIVVNGVEEFYHELDLPDEAKRSLGL